MTQLSDDGCNTGCFHQGLNYFGVRVSKLGGKIGNCGGEVGNRFAIMGGGRGKIGDGVDSLLLVGGVGLRW